MDVLNQNGKIAYASILCTYGKLFQGALDGEPCLVSCPFDIYSTAQITSNLPDSQRSYGKKVVRAHSRTIVGLIFQKDSDLEDVVGSPRQKLSKKIQIRSAALIGGGATFSGISESETP